MNITLDPNAARKADRRSTESGKYIGTLTKAMLLEAKTGSKGIEFDFKSADGAMANRIQIWTYNSKGEPLSGINAIHALLTCLGLREIKQGEIKAMVWDDVAKQMVEAVVAGFPDLMNKTVGVLLRKRIHEYNGREYNGFVINNWFCAQTERTASEILDRKTEPETLPKLVEWLVENPVLDERKKRGIPTAPARKNIGQTQGIGDLVDDIPF